MDEQIQAIPSAKNTAWEKTKLISNWVLGVLFSVAAFFELLEFSYGTITLFLCAALTLPPLYDRLKKKFNFSLPLWLKIIIILGLVYLTNYIFIIEP